MKLSLFCALWNLVLPLSKPVLAVIMIYTIVGVWNACFEASIYTTDKAIQPVQLYVWNILASTANMFQNEVIGSKRALSLHRIGREALYGQQAVKQLALCISAREVNTPSFFFLP
ncbi:MAG: hypothetical protein HFH93_11640 [Lachnospiraceae bacterium]|nr:hypothetical protein [Lachnospiraceae bacterium]